MLYVVLIIGSLIAGGLAFYAGRLLARLRRQNRLRDEAIAQRNANLFESIATIALAMQQGQCPLSEGSIRLSVLLDHLVLDTPRSFDATYPAIHEMHERIKHMPTHEARKQYPRKEIRQMDTEREGYEVEMTDAIQQDVAALLIWVRQQRKEPS